MKSTAGIVIAVLVMAAVVIAVFLFRDEADPDDRAPVEIETLDELPERPVGETRDSEFEATEAPDFELERLEGGSFRMSDHRGEVVVVNFWATWCGPCRFEIPEFIELYEEYHEEGLTIVGISTDDDFDVVRPFAEEMGINYPIVIDEGDVSSAFGGIYGLPTTFLVDREGMVRERILGLVSRSTLEPRLQILLSQEG
ncbi:MAG: TlpA family protein disulfide reductase [Bacteroidota bacterium]